VSGLTSIAGGKLTTHREIAQKIVDGLMRKLGRPSGRCPTLDTPLPGARENHETADLEGIVPGDIANMLASRYGSRATMVVAIIRERPDMAARLVPGAPALRAEVIHAIRSEMAASVSDFLVRRTSMVWRDPAAAIAAAPEVARLMGSELGWSDERVAAEANDFFSRQALHDDVGKGEEESAVSRQSGEGADGRVADKIG
jgi:glycerol-3-phosphate dehydrogenase